MDAMVDQPAMKKAIADDPVAGLPRRTAMNTLTPIAAYPRQMRSMLGVTVRRDRALHRMSGRVEMRRQTESDATPDFSALLVAVGERRDVEAFEVLFRHFAPRVKAFMARMAGESQKAEELMQETMIAVWNKAGSYDASKGAASTWIFTIARNLRIDAFRRDKRPEFDPNDPAFVQDDAPPADEIFEAQEVSAQLHQAMKALSEDQMALLKLAFFEDHSHSTIASRLNIPLGTVKSRLRLAFVKLRSALDRNGEVS
jgi:RNA polymerase sigma factor (sigma-70 family)